jgi:predicted ArsR family transcriptional regulator
MSPGPDPQITAVDILRVCLSSPDPAFVPAEVAAELDVTTEGARHQMTQLVDRGLLERKKPGSRTVLYWVTDAGREYYFEETQ